MKIMKKIYSRIFLFITIIVVFMIWDCRVVNAEDVDKCSEVVVYNKYKPLVNTTATDVTIKLTYDDSVKKSDYKDVIFSLKTVNGKEIAENYELSADIDKSLVLSIEEIKKWNDSKDTAIFGFIKTAGTDPDCDKDISLTIKVAGFGRLPSTSGSSGKLVADYDFNSAKMIDCNKKDSWDSADREFNTYFCAGKEKANELGHIYNSGYTISNPLQCKKNQIYQQGELKGGNYYTNVDYYYGTSSNESDKPIASYTYHFSPGVENKKVDIKCNKTCDEVLEVNYGPPIASRAGLCFEYNVKIISRTNCYATGSLPAPETYSVCTPYPYCTEPGWSGNAGGPNEDFDRCIKSCDGGKYTKKCSSKCYNSIYKKSNKMSSFNNNYFANKLGNQGLKMGDKINAAIKDCAKNDYSVGYYRSGEKNYGCYYYNGTIINWYGLEIGYKEDNFVVEDIKYYKSWAKGDYEFGHAPGRWYKENETWGIGTTYSVPYDEGFYREPHVGSNWCNDTCSWNGCSSDSELYLNEYNKRIDDQKNKDEFDRAKGLCGSKTSCTKTITTTTSFTMKAKIYPEDSKNPYDGVESIKIKEDGVEVPDKVDTSDSADSKYFGTIIKESDIFDPGSSQHGCYDSGAALYKNRYRVKLGFPGTWFNMKNGSMSYKKHAASDPAWYVEEDKFCLPTNLNKTNQDWLDYYLKNINLTKSERDIIAKKDDPDDTVVSVNNYNIEATIKDFGYHKWNFIVQCFFASDCPGEKCDFISNIKVRSVDLSNMFPRKDDPESLIENSKEKAEAKEYPFNWSEKSNTEKNSGYVIQPEKLREKIHSSSGSIYDESNLEYFFDLSPSDISSLKSKTSNYTLFSNGDYYKNCSDADSSCKQTPNGIPRYVSKTVTDYAKFRLRVDTINGTGVFCNNVKDANTGECEDYK